jgi:lipopolysaccharide export system protein LptA
MRLRGAFGADILVLQAITLFVAAQVHGQGLNLPGADSRAPIEINADQGIEWLQKGQAYVARGNARAKQGNVSVHADVLTAYYEGGKEGRPSRIIRIDADKNVRIASPGETATGEKAVYDVERGILVLTGKPRLVTSTDRITARDSLEYWTDRNMVVARGEAVAVRGDKRLAARVLSAHFVRDSKLGDRIVRIDAFDDVLISSPGEIVRATKGVYDVDSGIATLVGSVKISRGQNQLNGERAEVDLNTGKSRLLSGPDGPVRGIIVPGGERRAGARGQPAPGAGERR